MMETNIETYEDDYPLFICESPLDAISLYELTKEPGIYIALSSMNRKNLNYAVHSFPTKNLGVRPVVLSQSQTLSSDSFCSNSSYQRILPIVGTKISAKFVARLCLCVKSIMMLILLNVHYLIPRET